jgi:hypothetical protein
MLTAVDYCERAPQDLSLPLHRLLMLTATKEQKADGRIFVEEKNVTHPHVERQTRAIDAGTESGIVRMNKNMDSNKFIIFYFCDVPM